MVDEVQIVVWNLGGATVITVGNGHYAGFEKDVNIYDGAITSKPQLRITAMKWV